MNVTTSGRGVWLCPCVCTATVGWHLGMSVREEDFLLKYQLLEPPTLGSLILSGSMASRFPTPDSCPHTGASLRHETLICGSLKI